MGNDKRKFVNFEELIKLSVEALRNVNSNKEITDEHCNIDHRIENGEIAINVNYSYYADNELYKYSLSSYIFSHNPYDYIMFNKGYVNIIKFYNSLFKVKLVSDIDTYHDILEIVLIYYNSEMTLKESFDAALIEYKQTKKLIKKR